jgi:hypothetical protein
MGKQESKKGSQEKNIFMTLKEKAVKDESIGL